MIYEVDFGIYKNFKNVMYSLERLKEMGVTHIELMPILKHNGKTAWGYETVSYMTIHPEYGTEIEFIELIKEAKKHDMKIILDMCFNHCGDTTMFTPEWFVMYDGQHTNYSGCGNTFNAHESSFIRYCMASMNALIALGVDGFRFDLAPLMMINEEGKNIYEGSLLERVDTEFADYIRIYEPWSCDCYYKSKFSTSGYEWNDRLRDAVRRYCLGRLDLQSVIDEMNAYDGNINFVTCHDGFSLWDFISYDSKQNWTNGEDNRDGNCNEICGVIAEEHRREVAIKALKLIILAKGIPMLRSYDEFLITLYGNNNNYKKSVFYANGDISEEISFLNELRKDVDYSKDIKICYNNDGIILQMLNGQVVEIKL